ncbi:hypothetical protein [Streptomyces sp. NBC_01537]|uniref:hypothetical protein n=1 Tax=Streptomyces sp. NBC_01537 TaxID=2903896 RepID=UPI00386E22B8
MGRALPALGLAAGAVVTERQAELLFGEGRHSDADRIERELLDDGAAPDTARLATVLGLSIEEIEKRRQVALLALDFVFRPHASLIVRPSRQCGTTAPATGTFTTSGTSTGCGGTSVSASGAARASASSAKATTRRSSTTSASRSSPRTRGPTASPL